MGKQSINISCTIFSRVVWQILPRKSAHLFHSPRPFILCKSRAVVCIPGLAHILVLSSTAHETCIQPAWGQNCKLMTFQTLRQLPTRSFEKKANLGAKKRRQMENRPIIISYIPIEGQCSQYTYNRISIRISFTWNERRKISSSQELVCDGQCTSITDDLFFDST